MSSFATNDLCDVHEARLASGDVQLMQPALLRLGARRALFHGQAVTLRLSEGNSLLAEAEVAERGGCVFVVDAGGSTRCAVLGGHLARAASNSGWAGLVVNGAVRDGDDIDACAIAVLALALEPRRSVKRSVGDRDVAVSFFGITVQPGDWIDSDRDGTLVSRSALHRQPAPVSFNGERFISRQHVCAGHKHGFRRGRSISVSRKLVSMSLN